jgi:hypothetical protein
VDWQRLGGPSNVQNNVNLHHHLLPYLDSDSSLVFALARALALAPTDPAPPCPPTPRDLVPACQRPAPPSPEPFLLAS